MTARDRIRPIQHWGLPPGPGKAHVYRYSACKDGIVVADVVRLEKGHTEGLEPKVTEELVKLMPRQKAGRSKRHRSGFKFYAYVERRPAGRRFSVPIGSLSGTLKRRQAAALQKYD